MMGTNVTSHSPAGSKKRISLQGLPQGLSGGPTPFFLEKAKPGLRGSTPDSEALASSDDEQDHIHRYHPSANMVGSKSGRRASWLTEANHVVQRKGSTTGTSSLTSTTPTSGPGSGDQPLWPPSTVNNPPSVNGRGHSSNSSFPWANAIWNNDTQKAPPSRLSEVLPSPKTTDPLASAGSVTDEPLLSPLSRESTTESSIPFAIPLQPTLKSYRSQSYSVGQLDPESIEQSPSTAPNQPFSGRMRGGLSHRPSRPSMLGDRLHDSSNLGQLREVDDDDESSNESGVGSFVASDQAKTIERLAMENAMLRQAAAQQLEASRARARTVTENVISQSHHARSLRQQPNSQESLRYHHSYTTATAEAEDQNFRYAQQEVSPRGHETRTLDSLRKGHWQSSLGFGGLPEVPQSRRHSFAEVPTRQPSISSGGQSPKGYGPNCESLRSTTHQASVIGNSEMESRLSQGESGEQAHFHTPHFLQERLLELEHLRDRNYAVSYFSKSNPPIRAGHAYQPSVSPTTLLPGYDKASPYGQVFATGQQQARMPHLLYVVTFKACRADIFYVSEGTGLQIKPGDLVIVEADRGTDLGTVAHERVTWSKAADLKSHFADEHYRWLMLFSRHGQNGAARPASSPFLAGAPHNGIGSQNLSQPGSQDPGSPEIKPKMIKRLAQPHEIQTLKDKEANEAKAKRVCQQKVAEQRLNMEILDAEFQMDWKKLTFYYFADSYINFNPLVTDLFKIYKTRIWMSAISQLSLPAPSAGLQLPVGRGPGAFISDLDLRSTEQPRGPSDYIPYYDSSMGQSRAGQIIGEHGHESNMISREGAQPSGSQPFQPRNLAARSIEQLSSHYGQIGQPILTPGASFGQLPYSSTPAPQVPYGQSADLRNGQRPVRNGQQDWLQSFQSMTLG